MGVHSSTKAESFLKYPFPVIWKAKLLLTPYFQHESEHIPNKVNEICEKKRGTR
jgi:hypothetical protein